MRLLLISLSLSLVLSKALGDFGHSAAVSQAEPRNPGSQKHSPRWQIPLLEHVPPPGQISPRSSSHSSPPHPGSQRQAECSHFPCAPQAFSEQPVVLADFEQSLP